MLHLPHYTQLKQTLAVITAYNYFHGYHQFLKKNMWPSSIWESW